MWMQIVGKIRLRRMPWINHAWQVALYPTASGLTTGRMPYGDEAFEIDFDFIAHELDIRTSRGDHGVIQLVPMSVSEFYGSVMEALKAFQMPVSIHRKPAEVESQLPFDEDDVHRIIRCRLRDPLLARRVFICQRAGPLSSSLLRKGEPGPLLLGELRPGCHAVLGRCRTAARRRRPQPSRSGDTRRVLARGKQRRVLARRSTRTVSALLQLRLP